MLDVDMYTETNFGLRQDKPSMYRVCTSRIKPLNTNYFEYLVVIVLEEYSTSYFDKKHQLFS